MAESLIYFSPRATPWDEVPEIFNLALQGQLNRTIKIFHCSRTNHPAQIKLRRSDIFVEQIIPLKSSSVGATYLNKPSTLNFSFLGIWNF